MSTGADDSGEVVEPAAPAAAGARPAPAGVMQPPGTRWPFLAELKRRNVVRVAILYLVACWLILEPVHVVFHMLEVPAWANRLVLLLMAIGLPAVVIFAWAFELTPEGVRPSDEVDRTASMTQRTGRRLNQAIIVLLGMAVAYLLLDKFWLSKHVDSGAVNAADSRVTAAVPAAETHAPINERSIAVLPFVDLSEKHDQEYFSDGLAEELLDLLAKVPGLQVIARTSSFSFRGGSADIPTIARQLAVANILEGGVRKSGGRLRVTTQLIKADTGLHLWSETYDRELKDVFAVQDEIANAVVAALKLRLMPSQVSRSDHRTANPEAYSEYLLGRQLHNRGNLDGFRRAIVAYRHAVALDPGYAAAFAGLAYSEDYVADSVGDAAGMQRARAAAERAVALAPEQADGYAARGFLRSRSWDWDGAEADFRKALALEPANAVAQRRYAQLLIQVGRLADAGAAAKTAVAEDPLLESAWVLLGMDYTLSGQPAAARQAYGRALEISPESTFAHFNLGLLDLVEGQPAEALATYEQIGDAPLRLVGLALAEHSLGHARASQQALDELLEKHGADSAYQIAQIYAWRGENAQAILWLERAFRQHDGGLSFIKSDPLLFKLRTDRGYDAMLQKLHLSREPTS